MNRRQFFTGGLMAGATYALTEGFLGRTKRTRVVMLYLDHAEINRLGLYRPKPVQRFSADWPEYEFVGRGVVTRGVKILRRVETDEVRTSDGEWITNYRGKLYWAEPVNPDHPLLWDDQAGIIEPEREGYKVEKPLVILKA